MFSMSKWKLELILKKLNEQFKDSNYATKMPYQGIRKWFPEVGPIIQIRQIDIKPITKNKGT